MVTLCEVKGCSSSHLRQWMITCTTAEKCYWCSRVIIHWRWCSKAAKYYATWKDLTGGCGSSLRTCIRLLMGTHNCTYMYICSRVRGRSVGLCGYLHIMHIISKAMTTKKINNPIALIIINRCIMLYSLAGCFCGVPFCWCWWLAVVASGLAVARTAKCAGTKSMTSKTTRAAGVRLVVCGRFVLLIYYRKTCMGQLGQRFFETLYQQGLQRSLFALVLFEPKTPEYLCRTIIKRTKAV